MIYGMIDKDKTKILILIKEFIIIFLMRNDRIKKQQNRLNCIYKLDIFLRDLTVAKFDTPH